MASLIADGAFDRDGVYAAVAARHTDAAVFAPPRSSAVLSDTHTTAPRWRDRHIGVVAEGGRVGWQKAPCHNLRAAVEADIARWKRAIGDALRSHMDRAPSGRGGHRGPVATIGAGRAWQRHGADQAAFCNNSARKVAWAGMSRRPMLQTCPFLTTAMAS